MARSIAASSSNSSRNRAVLLLAAVFGLLSAALVFAFLTTRGGDESTADDVLNAGQVESVVVLTRDVGFGEEITSDMLTTKAVPTSALLPGYRTDDELDELVGMVTTTNMLAGEQVVTAKVSTFGGQETLSYKIPDGMRALSLQVPHEAWVAAGLVQPGDRVDILAITTLMKVDPLTGEERPNVISGIIAQDVPVLAVAQSLVRVVPELDDGATATTPEATTEDGESVTDPDGLGTTTERYREVDGETYEEAISVTIAATPEIVAKVALIDAMKDDQGQYRVVPRQQGDHEQITGDKNWTFDEIFDLGQ